ncbi:MAG: hypothetical protein ACOH2A_11770 [Sphingobacteriaceae bacterium]
MDGFSYRIDLLFKTIVYRILQEMINKYMKYLDADLVTIDLNKS